MRVETTSLAGAGLRVRVAGVDGDKFPARQRPPVKVECVFFGPLREPVGQKHVVRSVPDGATVETLLRDLEAEYDGLTFFEDGDLRGDRTVTVEGKDVRHREGTATPLSADDTVRMTTAVYGG